MISQSKLKSLCNPPLPDKAFFRPFICKGNLEDVDIFLVGINPATPISPNKGMDLKRYIELILDYEMFMSYYKKIRLSNKKTQLSRTRIGINSFIDWLSDHTTSSVIETNVIPFPTAKYRLLKKEPPEIINKAKLIFFETLNIFEPSLIILHGKPSLDKFLDVLNDNGILKNSSLLKIRIEEAEEKVPFFTFSYKSGKYATVVACRHFMYYGKTGNSFRNFKEKLKGIL